MSDDHYRLLEPLIPPAKSGGRPRATDMRRLLDSMRHYVVVMLRRVLDANPAQRPRSSREGACRTSTAKA